MQAPGVIPTHVPRRAVARPGRRNVTSPRAQEALARCGCEGATVQLEYPSDLTVNGLAFGPIAERIVANLDEVGISVELVPGPIATTLENYRAGNEQMGLWLWNPDYPDPQDYLVFGPGALVGLRAGWAERRRPGDRGGGAGGGDHRRRRRRAPLYEQFQQLLNESGPFFPLFQPTAAVVSVTDRVDRRRRSTRRSCSTCGCWHPA